MRILRLAFVLSLSALATACGDGGGATDDSSDGDDGIDAGGCNPTDGLPVNWRPIGMVSTGALTKTTTDGVTSATVDASAGGLAGAADSPYVYLDLSTGTKVDITDVQSYSSQDWDLALKRASLRINGGDSGPGGVEVASVDAETLAAVTVAPADGAFVTDDWASDACVVVATPSGEPFSAMADWYAYDDAAHTLTPFAKVYVVRARDGVLYKLRIVNYYGDDAMPMKGGIYQLEWASL